MNGQSNRNLLTSTGAVCFLVLLAAACNWFEPKPNSNETHNNQATSSPTITPTPTSEARLRRYLVNVSITDRNDQSWQPLSDDSWRKISGRTWIKTDADGEGWVRIHDCMLIYVFQTTQMVTARCSKAEAESGNVNCLIEGTAVYNNHCDAQAQQLIQTRTAEIAPHGTWFAVTYLPERQLTLVMVFEGSASVKAITDLSTESLTDAKEVNAGQIWYTVPDAQLKADPDNAAFDRTVRSVSEYRNVVQALAGPWTTRISERAKQDGIVIPSLDDDQAPPSPGSPDESKPPGESETSGPNCDCDHISAAGVPTEVLRNKCLAIEQNLKSQYQEAKKVVGRCDPVASGPNARPK